jgi:2-oxoglutarate dehydrogenase E2 component (dihydrolipoamide succinyltransferase)
VQVEVKVPVLAESVAEATLMNWHKQPGDSISRGDSLIDIETDKVTLEVAALNDGVLVEILKGDGELVESNEIIARIDTEAGAVKQAPLEKVESEPQQQSLPVDEPQEESPKLSPAVRNLLQENKLNAEQIPLRDGSDRITKEDVLAFLEENKSDNTEMPVPTPAEQETSMPVITPAASTPSAIEGERPEERVPMTRLRKRTAERLLAAQHENALLTTFNEVNMQPVMDLRARYKEEFEKTHGVKLGFMSFFTSAAVEALKKFPLVNASIDGSDIVYHGFFDIGIAVSAPKGLVVPILRDADQLSFADIESNIRELGLKARDSKLTMEDLTGGTFTITNGGIFGSLLSTPILNPPQSAILGMHKIQDRPVAENGEVVIRPIMNLALSYDHRIIDGREAVQFLVSIKEQIEDPARLLLQI